MHEARNEEICRDYIGGMTLKECSEKHHLSHERIRQVLRKAGVFKGARARPQRSNMREFLGVNLTEADKLALRAEAKRRGLSMSRLSAEIIKEMLDGLREGVKDNA